MEPQQTWHWVYGVYTYIYPRKINVSPKKGLFQ